LQSEDRVTPRRKYTPEQIIQKLREAEIRLSQGKLIVQVCRSLAISEQTFYWWRKEFGGMRLSQS
jgi:putative transposase